LIQNNVEKVEMKNLLSKAKLKARSEASRRKNKIFVRRLRFAQQFLKELK